ncbi:hypothetical protein ACFPN2_02920 [Steroidobacter flavus]|uniref:Uncharacterized protein n=1 Tax=Steroidobacter flavus TaxID=1842136 RepID=A0ABV8SNQ1_9GAMM
MARDQRLRRFGVFLFVTGAHVLLLLLPLDVERRERGEPAGGERTAQLFFLRAPAVERRARREPRQPGEPEIKTNIEVAAPASITAIPPSGSAAAGPGAALSIDWSEEARRSAADAVAKAPSHDRSRCDSTGLDDPALPNCKPAPEFRWAPPKAGFSGGLPYISVGDHCVIGLGFFGCGFGKPAANGNLFDGMDAPDRDRSSVPDPNPPAQGRPRTSDAMPRQ